MLTRRAGRACCTHQTCPAGLTLEAMHARRALQASGTGSSSVARTSGLAGHTNGTGRARNATVTRVALRPCRPCSARVASEASVAGWALLTSCARLTQCSGCSLAACDSRCANKRGARGSRQPCLTRRPCLSHIAGLTSGTGRASAGCEAGKASHAPKTGQAGWACWAGCSLQVEKLAGRPCWACRAGGALFQHSGRKCGPGRQC